MVSHSRKIPPPFGGHLSTRRPQGRIPRLGSDEHQINDGNSHPFGVRIAVGLFVGWILLARVGPLFELAPGIRAWYPSAALLAASLVLWGGRALLPIILASSTLALFSPVSSEPLWRWLLVSTLLKVIYWAAARLLKVFDFDQDFSSAADVALFAGLFGAASAVVAIVGVLALESSAELTSLGILRLLQTYWLGDFVAVCALAPAMIVGGRWYLYHRDTGEGAAPVTWTRRDIVQGLSILASIAAATALVPLIGFLAYSLCFLPLGWIALVHGPRGAAFANVLLVVGALLSVSQWTSIAPTRLEVQAFTAVLALTGLVIGSVVNERERAFALLALSEERYRGLVELLPDPLILHEQGRIVFANGAAVDVFGAASAESLRGVHLVDLVAPRSKLLVQERMTALARGDALPLVRHTVTRLDDGVAVEIEAVTVPFTYEGRSAALSVARDVTSRVRLEDELRQAQRMEGVGQLAGGVAHDFNNLLTVITSYSELILESHGDDAALSDDVREIQHAAARAAALTRQLLSFSRRQVLQPESLQISEVVGSIGGLLRRLISAEVNIVFLLDASAGAVLADRGQIEQVIVNLAVNARDAMPEGGTLTIETRGLLASEGAATARCATRAHRYVEISVRDTGVGMDESTMRQIFDPFFTTKEVGQGTGLGLATVHGIVEQSGGTILVDSVIGDGTTFRVILPAIVSLEADVQSVVLPDTTGASPHASLARGRVLLVEDDDAVRAIIRRTLVRAGYEIFEAVDGVEAIDVLEANAADLDVVLSDVAMPRMDGRQLAQQLRERWPRLPLVMMSGFADPDVLGAARGGTTLLLKPFTSQSLLSAIEEALERLV